jgi:hypothetical protein
MSLVTVLSTAFAAIGVDTKALFSRLGIAETKLSGIEAGATADQTAAEITALYEGTSGVNRYTSTEKTKLAGIEAGAKADQTAPEIVSLYEGTSGVNRYTTPDKTKVGYLTVTQVTDLDAIRTAINEIGTSPMSLKGEWSAAAAFPSGAKIGWTYIVSVAGTRDGIDFEVGDLLIATKNAPSATVYAANWYKQDGSDRVISVNGRNGAVVGLQEASLVGDTARSFVSDYTTARDA